MGVVTTLAISHIASHASLPEAHDSIGRVGPATPVGPAKPRELQQALPGTGIDREAVIELVAKLVQVHEEAEVMLNGNRRYAAARVLPASGNRALEAQERGGIEIGIPAETFFIHPPDEGA